MKINTTLSKTMILTGAIVMASTAVAQTQVPNVLQAGQPARAADVNANFDTLESAIDQNAADIALVPAGPPGADAVIDPALVQTRVGGSCAFGFFVAAVAEDGSVTCTTGTEVDANTRYGDTALSNNTTGLANTAVGVGALQFNTIGVLNTAIGVDALGENTEGDFNTATGVNALWFNTTGSNNTATGMNALFENTSGSQNTAIGRGALFGNTSAVANVAIGVVSMHLNTVGSRNTAVGNWSLYSNSDGVDNTVSGFQALYSNTSGFGNTVAGMNAMYGNTTGSSNTAVGNNALLSNTTGSENTAIGARALEFNTTGIQNIAVGITAGISHTTGNNNIAIGNAGIAGESNTTRIGTNQARAFVDGIYGVNTGGLSVVIDTNGQLGTVPSSARYKQEISDMGAISDRLLKLRPVTFHYKEAYARGENPLEYGLIAEEVAQVFPELVVLNDENQPETVKYRLLSTLLLNELQKQNKQLVTLSGRVADVDELRGQVAELNQLVQRVAQMNGLLTGELVANQPVE